MPEIRETEVERDAEGRVVGYRERVTEPAEPRRRRGGGFGWGLLFGVLLIAVGIIAFAYSQGSFQQAGVEADQMTAQLEEQTDQAVGAADTALQDGADSTREAVGETPYEPSETATN